MTLCLGRSTLAGKMEKEIPGWLKKSVIAVNNIESAAISAKASKIADLEKRDRNLSSKIESEVEEALFLLDKWREFRVDEFLEDVRNFLQGDELTPTNLTFTPSLIESYIHHRIEPSETGFFISVDYGYGFIKGDKTEDLAKAIKGLMARQEITPIKPEDIKFSKVERGIQNIRFSTPDSNWGSSFSHELITTLFSLELSTNGFYVSQGFKNSALRSAALGKVDSANQLRDVVDGFISNVLSTPPTPETNIYVSNH